MNRIVCGLTVAVLSFLTLALSADTFNGRFTYQGRLFNEELPATGSYDLRFILYSESSPDIGLQIGTEIIQEDLSVADGYFTTSLDFGLFAFNGQQRWLSIALRPGGLTDPNAFVELNPLQEITPVPYSFYSLNAGTAAIAQTLSGQTADDFAPVSHTHPGEQIVGGAINPAVFSAYADLLAEGFLANNTGDLAQNNSILQRSLNADLLDSLHAIDFALVRHQHSFRDMTDQLTDDQVPDNITILYAASAGSAIDAKNADTLDNKDSSAFALVSHIHDAGQITTGTLNYARFSAYGDLFDEGYLKNLAGSLALNNGALQATLNADLLDGLHASSFVQAAQDYGRSGVAANLYEGASTLTSLYVNESQANSITTGMVTDNTLTAADLAAGSVTGSELANSSVTSDHIAFSLSYTGTDNNGGLVSMTNTANGLAANYPAGLYGAANGTVSGTRVMGVLGAAPGLGSSSPFNSLPLNRIGVAGVSNTGYGIAGVSSDETGIYGSSFMQNGIEGFSTGASQADNGVYGETNSTQTTDAGIYGKSTDAACGLYGYSSSGYGVRGYSVSGDGIYGASGASDKHAGYFYTSVGSSLTGAALYTRTLSAGGIALWAHNDSASNTDTTAVFSNDGSGYLIKGFGGDGGEHEFSVDNDGKVWAEGGVEVPTGARVVTPTLEITGGADLAENFDIRHPDADGKIQPGMVVCIDPAHPGKLTVSTRAHDRKVAGIISGAGGIKPGMMMGQQDTLADGSNPVALTGRVYCLVDTCNGAIEPGDLLTTSDTPGHAMKVTNHTQAAGAILGKAMTALPEGKGLVLVLVSLQ